MTELICPLPPGEPGWWRYSHPLPSVPSDSEIAIVKGLPPIMRKPPRQSKYRETEIREKKRKQKRNMKRKTTPTSFRWELPNVRGCNQVHHCLLICLHAI